MDQVPVLVGASTDGASVNVGSHGGMKATLKNSLPWFSGHGALPTDWS